MTPNATIYRYVAGSSGTLRRRWILVWLIVLACSIDRVQSQEEWVWSGPGFVLLKNGNVLSATDVVPRGKQLAIRLDKTGEVRIPNKDVVTIGHHPIELCNYQVSKTTRWGAGEHWQLAKWCLRQGLVEQSRIHYEQLKQLSGDHEKFKQLDTELKHALLQDPVMKEALRSAYPDRLEGVSSSQSASDQNKQVPPTSEPSKPMREVDAVSQEYFRQQIQPFLAMRCGQAGCHGAFGKSNYHVAKNGMMRGQRSSDLSLDSAVRFLDSEKVESTTLWINATTAHGTQNIPSLASNVAVERDFLNRLQHWHQTLYRGKAATYQPNQVPLDSNLADRVATRNNAGISNGDFSRPPSTGHQSASNTPPTKASLRGDLIELEREIARLEEIERKRKLTNRHDPDEFNRRFGTTAPSQAK